MRALGKMKSNTIIPRNWGTKETLGWKYRGTWEMGKWKRLKNEGNCVRLKPTGAENWKRKLWWYERSGVDDIGKATRRAISWNGLWVAESRVVWVYARLYVCKQQQVAELSRVVVSWLLARQFRERLPDSLSPVMRRNNLSCSTFKLDYSAGLLAPGQQVFPSLSFNHDEIMSERDVFSSGLLVWMFSCSFFAVLVGLQFVVRSFPYVK